MEKDQEEQEKEHFLLSLNDACGAKLQEYFDGFLLVGYRAGDHEKFAYGKCEDPACRDGLSYFRPAVCGWMSLAAEDADGDDTFPAIPEM